MSTDRKGDTSMRMLLCTCPQDSADGIADAILKDRLAACVNIVPGIRSKYWWEGKINTDDESLLIIKTRNDLVADLITRIKEAHPCDVPEIIAFQITEGNADYLRWIGEETGQPGG
jgi:periplasmic divalent cation tolerance protein